MRRKISSAASGVCAWLEWAGAGALAFLVALTVVDVAGRYALSAPAPGATEMTEFGVAALVFAALPAVTWRGGHVAVDLLDRFIPAAKRRLRAAFVAALFCPCLWAPAWRIAELAQRSAERGEVSEYLSFPLSAAYSFIAAMCVVAGGLSLLRAAMIFSASESEWESAGGEGGGGGEDKHD